MKRSLPLLLLLVASACGVTGPPTAISPSTTSTQSDTVTSAISEFPVSVVDDLGPVTIETRPGSIVSLSATATEMLYAVGGGDQVVAVDDQSDYPEQAPSTDLSGFTPNLEAILAHEPDLVIIAFDPADNPISEALESVGVPVLVLDAAASIDDVYRQIEVIGAATGHSTEADQVNDRIRDDLDEIVAESADLAAGVTYYHELDPSLFTVTSSTFIGEVYSLLGMVNIADAADASGQASGYPQLSSEFVVAADPEIIFLADADFGESLQTVGARPGWDEMTAVGTGAVVPLDSDIASRWGPRIVDFLRTVADAVVEHGPAQ